MVDIDVCASGHLKEELPWAVDKWLQVISTIMFLKNSWSTKERNGTKKCNIVYIVMWPLLMYSNYFEIHVVSTVTFLAIVSQTNASEVCLYLTLYMHYCILILQIMIIA